MSEQRTTNGGAARFAALVTAAFMAVTVPVLLRHEMWRDEVQAWLLARDTPSLAVLFHALRYEGHPALWYLLLRPLAHLTTDPRAIQWVSLACAAATVYVFARYAPFSRGIRALFAFGYFPVYGYSLIARSYSLQMLLLVVLVAIMTRAPRRRIAIGIAMLLVANVTVYGAMLVMALAGGMIVDAFMRKRRGDARAFSRVVTPCVIAAIGVVLAVAQARPPADARYRGNGLATNFRGMGDPEQSAYVWNAYVPVTPIGGPRDLLDANLLLSQSPRAIPVATVLSILIAAVAVVVMRRAAVALWFYLFATVGLMLFSLLFVRGALYHHGYFFLALVLAAWLAEAVPSSGMTSSRAAAWLDRNRERLFALLLLAQVAGGASRLVGDWLYPYSEAENAARYLVAHGLDGPLPVLVYPAFNGVPVGAYIGRPVYSVSSHQLETYMRHDVAVDNYTDAALLAAVRDCCTASGERRILVVNRVLTASDSTLAVRELARFSTTIANEPYFVYDVRRKP